MAIKNLTALYQFNAYPSPHFDLQSTPYYTTLDMITPKFSTLTANTATYKAKVLYGGTYTSYLYVFDDIDDYTGGYSTEFTQVYPTEDWVEVSFSADQLSLMKSGDFYVFLKATGSVSYYTSGSDAPHLVTSSGSAQIKYYDGSAWANGIVKYYDGSNWVDGVAKIWDGTAWVDTQ